MTAIFNALTKLIEGSAMHYIGMTIVLHESFHITNISCHSN